MKRSYIIALSFALLVAGYFGVRAVMASSSGTDQASQPAAPGAAAGSAPTSQALTTVTVLDLVAQDHTASLTLKGQTEAARTVTVRSETAGVVRSTPAREGSVVKAGTTLCRLDVEARDALVAQAQAEVDARRLEFEGAERLARDGWRAPTQASAAKAALDAASAQLSAAKIERQRTEIKAPFTGLFNTRLAEQGDFLAPGGPCGVIVELDPLLVTVQASETVLGSVKEGNTAQVVLSDGRQMNGQVQRISRTATERTRTFTIELKIANADMTIPAGMTATVKLPVAKVRAHQLSPATLTLNAEGALGVRTVQLDNTALFVPVSVLDEAPTGVWVSGLSERVRLIVMGQELVSDGSKVDPRLQGAPSSEAPAQ
jgi:multidrug efflux system membrane fusion protein